MMCLLTKASRHLLTFQVIDRQWVGIFLSPTVDGDPGLIRVEIWGLETDYVTPVRIPPSTSVETIIQMGYKSSISCCVLVG